MKVKDFLEWFADFDPESELEFELLEYVMYRYGEYEVTHTPLDVTDTDYLDETDTVFVTLELGD